MPQEDPERLLRNVARRIAELRLAKGLTQEQIAEALGVAVQNFRRIERGRQNLTLKTMAAIADAIGVRVIDLLQPPATPETRQQQLVISQNSAKLVHNLNVHLEQFENQSDGVRPITETLERTRHVKTSDPLASHRLAC